MNKHLVKIFDNTLLGLMPAGLTEFDMGLHLGAGALATRAGLRKSATSTDLSSN